jgi:hypothetical protein
MMHAAVPAKKRLQKVMFELRIILIYSCVRLCGIHRAADKEKAVPGENPRPA